MSLPKELKNNIEERAIEIFPLPYGQFVDTCESLRNDYVRDMSEGAKIALEWMVKQQPEVAAYKSNVSGVVLSVKDYEELKEYPEILSNYQPLYTSPVPSVVDKKQTQEDLAYEIKEIMQGNISWGESTIDAHAVAELQDEFIIIRKSKK